MKKIFFLFALLFAGFSSSCLSAEEDPCGCKQAVRAGFYERLPLSFIILNSPDGFEIESSGIGQNLYLQYDIDRFSIKLSGEIVGVDQELKYKDSSLGKINTKNQMLIGDYSLVTNDVYSIRVGVGILHQDRNGVFSIGNYKLSTTGSNWSPVLEGVVEIPLDENLGLFIAAQLIDINLKTKIPGVSDIDSRITGYPFLFGLNYKFFK